MADKATITQKVTDFINGELNEINNMGIDIFDKKLDISKLRDFKYKDTIIFLQNIEAPKQINIAKDEKLGKTCFTNILKEYKKLEQTQGKDDKKKSYTIQSTELKKKPKIATIIKIGSVLNGWKKDDPPITDLYTLSSQIKEKENYKNETDKNETDKNETDKIPTELYNAIEKFIGVLITFNNDLSEKIEAKKNEWKTLYESLKKILVERLKTLDGYLKSRKKTQNDNKQSENKVKLYEKAFEEIKNKYTESKFNQEELKKIMTPILSKNLNDMLLYGDNIMEQELYPSGTEQDKKFMLCLYSLNLNLVKLTSINNGARSKMDELLTSWLKEKNVEELKNYTNALKKIAQAPYSEYILTEWLTLLPEKLKDARKKAIVNKRKYLLQHISENTNDDKLKTWIDTLDTKLIKINKDKILLIISCIDDLQSYLEYIKRNKKMTGMKELINNTKNAQEIIKIKGFFNQYAIYTQYTF